MVKPVVPVLLAVLVAAHCKADSIPAVSGTSDQSEDRIRPEEGKPKLRVNDEATEVSDDERGSTQRLSSMLTSLREGETSDGALRAIVREGQTSGEAHRAKKKRERKRVKVPNDLHKIPLTRNEALFEQEMQKLGINMQDVESYTKQMRTNRRFKKMDLDDYVFKLMVAGRMIFTQEYRRFRWGHQAHPAPKAMGGEWDFKPLEEWKKYLAKSGVAPIKFYAKMYWLKKNKNVQLSDDDLAMMAFGSELLTKKDMRLPPATASKTIKKLIKQKRAEPEVEEKLRLWLAKNDPSLSGKSTDELLEKARLEVAGDALDKEKRPKVLGFDLNEKPSPEDF